MNEEYIYVKTNDVQKDMHDFVNQFGDEIAYISYPKNIIKLKSNIIYRFTYTLVGIRKYFSYAEIYNYHLEFQNKQLREQLEESEKARKETIKILKECLQLSPHEFDWEEQAENVINKLDIDKGE